MCFSMNSLMSRRVIDCSSSKRNSASALASSVLPTPLGPRKRKRPDGLARDRAGPTRPRRTARDTARTASSWPDDALGEALLHLEELVGSRLSSILATGMPVQSPRTMRDVLLGHDVRRVAGRLRCRRRPRAASRRALHVGERARARARRGARSLASRAPLRARPASCAYSARSARGAAIAPRRDSSFARISLTVGSSSRISFSMRSRVLTLIASDVAGERRRAAP